MNTKKEEDKMLLRKILKGFVMDGKPFNNGLKPKKDILLVVLTVVKMTKTMMNMMKMTKTMMKETTKKPMIMMSKIVTTVV